MIFEWLKDQTMNNDFFGGAMFLSAITWIGFTLRKVPSTFVKLTKRRLCYTFSMSSDNDLFDSFSEWVLTETSFDRVKSYSLEKEDSSSFLNEEEEKPRRYRLPLSGHYFGWLNKPRLPSFLGVSKERNENGGGYTMELTVSIWFMSKKRAEKIINSFSSPDAQERKKLHIRTGAYSTKRISKRPFASLFHDNGLTEEIELDLERAIERFPIMSEKGLLAKRTYLFYGPPGTGKTTFALAIASKLDWTLRKISGSKDDGEFAAKWEDIPEKSVVLIDDIDASSMSIDREKDKGVSLSQILSSLDGADSLNECVIVLTTNHIEKIDKAVLRSGRVDVIRECPEMNLTTASLMLQYYSGTPIEECGEIISREFIGPSINQADLQEFILKTYF